MAAEEAATARKTTGRTRTITDAKPESIGPDVSGMGEILEVKASEPGITAEELRGFAAHHRAQLYKPRLGGHIGGGAQIQAQSENLVLNVLESLATWLENGRPGPVQSLTEAELTSYRAAKKAGAVFPPEIEAQL